MRLLILARRRFSFPAPWVSEVWLQRFWGTWAGPISNLGTSRMRSTFMDRVRTHLQRAGFRGIQLTGSRTLQPLIWLYASTRKQRNLRALLLNERTR